MITLKIISTSIFQLFSLFFVVLYLLGILNTHFSNKNNYCVMTYMFEYPQFVHISVPEIQIYPQYALYAYGEGRLTEKARKMWFDGIPVLFLPGNSGSHMQARSLASVALRMAISNSHDYHFDYFTVSYNEDLSAVYGGVLQSETEFTAACITKILSLYKNNKYTKTVPTSIILIGHSMGGVIAKRLMAYPQSIGQVNIAITLAAPLEAPVMNTDIAMDRYYRLMEFEWDIYINSQPNVKEKKLLLSFGNGVRDVLMPSGLTSTNDSDLNALTTAIPGVWVSPDHVSIVWCKQLVMTINRFLFSIVSQDTGQVAEDKQILVGRARQYFEANRSMVLGPDIPRATVAMIPDAFWYEDNRRVYQIARPEINKTTYLMIRLVAFPQNRFVAIESVNVDDKDWIFGCNAEYTYGTHRYCKQATSLTELSRWSGAASEFGKRKLATIHLHDVKEKHPDWTHVVVKVSPTRKPILLNVDISDHASRVITADLPSDFSFSKHILKQETEPTSLYYSVVLPGFEALHQAYLLYVEPTGSCRAASHHVTAELHVPWARNHEYTHYFTHLKRSPMKLRLFKSNPNVTEGLDATEHVQITLLLDPQCTYTISISTSWYHRLAQLARNYTPVLLPYIAAIVLLAARSNLGLLQQQGKCASIHSALMSESVKPYYALVFSRLALTFMAAIPPLAFLLDTASSHNLELRHFSRSLLVLPAYMTALGALNVAAAALLAVMVFSSQLAHRLLFRIVWCGGSGLAERVAHGLQKVPMVVSAALVGAAPLSCGAASLAAGAAFYAFMISKMYEEYLEDYVYKIMAKLASRACRMFFSKKNNKASNSSSVLVPTSETTEEESSPDGKLKAIADNDETTSSSTETKQIAVADKDKDNKQDKKDESTALIETDSKGLEVADTAESTVREEEKVEKKRRVKTDEDLDEELNNLNFHVMMFFLWMVVTLVNVPALMTWARNFKYSMVLKPDTSYHSGLIMSACSAFVWQMDGPKRNLRYYEAVSALLFTMAVFILALGPLSLSVVNYGVTVIFAVITLQQLLDKEVKVPEDITADENASDGPMNTEEEKCEDDVQKNNSENSENEKSSENNEKSQSDNANSTEDASGDCDVCSESGIYRVFKNLRDKFDYTNDEL